ETSDSKKTTVASEETSDSKKTTVASEETSDSEKTTVASEETTNSKATPATAIKKDINESNKFSIENFAINKKIQGYPGIKTDYSIPLDSQYSFFTKFTQKSKWINETNGQVITTEKGHTASNSTQNIVPVTSPDDKFRVTNVGMYKGVMLDLIIGVTYFKKVNYEPWFGDKIKSYIELGADEQNFLHIYTSGDKGTEVNLSLTTVASGTNNKIITSGVLSYDYITNNKELLVQASQIKELYARSDSIVKYDDNTTTTINNNKKAIAFSADIIGNNDGLDQVIQVYENLDTINYGVKQAAANAGVIQKLNSRLALQILPDNPVLSKDYSGNSNINEYQAIQFIPPQPISNFTSYKLTMDISNIVKPLDINEIKVTDLGGVDITSEFDLSIQDVGNIRRVTAEAKKELLDSSTNLSSLYNNYQVLVVPVEMDYTKDFSSFIDIELNKALVKSIGYTEIGNFENKFKSQEDGVATFASQSFVKINYLDSTEREIIPHKTYVNDIRSEKEYFYEAIDGFNLTDEQESVLLKQTYEPISHDFHYEDKRMASNFEVEAVNSPLDKNYILPSDQLTFKLHIRSNMKESHTLKEGTVKVQYDSNVLEVPENIRLLDAKGNLLSTGIYSNDSINADFPTAELVDNEYTLVWESTVKNIKVISPGSHLMLKANLDINVDGYGFNFQQSESTLNYEILTDGKLKFNVPEGLSFENIPVEKNNVNKKVTSYDGQMSLYDSDISNNWNIKVKLDTPGFIGVNKNKLLPVAIAYKDEYTSFLLTPGQDNVVFSSNNYDKFTEYNFSDIWNTSNDDGFSIVGNTSGVPVDDYAGTLTWSISFSEY
ncbi:hypothetical protein, partial [Vagococcus xieshaowenii]